MGGPQDVDIFLWAIVFPLSGRIRYGLIPAVKLLPSDNVHFDRVK